MRLVNIGYGNYASEDRILSLVSPASSPIKRMIQDARERGHLIDASYGRKTRAVLIMDNDFIVLSALQIETLAARLEGKDMEMSADGDDGK